MPNRLLFPWLPRLLRWLSLLTAGVLFALVFLSPLLDNESAQAAGCQRLLALFAGDKSVRRSALASGVGLVVTAFVFFKSPPRSPLDARHSTSSRPPTNVVGA